MTNKELQEELTKHPDDLIIMLQSDWHDEGSIYTEVTNCEKVRYPNEPFIIQLSIAE